MMDDGNVTLFKGLFLEGALDVWRGIKVKRDGLSIVSVSSFVETEGILRHGDGRVGGEEDFTSFALV